jgi:hypothetical protein
MSKILYTFDPRAAHTPDTIGAFVAELVALVFVFAFSDDDVFVDASSFVNDGQTVEAGRLPVLGGIVDD